MAWFLLKHFRDINKIGKAILVGLLSQNEDLIAYF